MKISKTHLNIHDSHYLICHPDIEGDRFIIGEALCEEAQNLPESSIVAPIIFSKDKRIYFAGGDFLPYSHLPMPWKAGQLWIGQVPENTEVGFIPLYCFLIPKKLYKKLDPPPYFGDNIVKHGDFIMRAKEEGAKCFVTPNVHIVWPYAYKPEMGKDKWEKTIRRSLDKFKKKWAKTLDMKYRLPVVIQSIITFAGGYNLHSYNVLLHLFKKKIRTYYQFIGGTNEDEGESETDQQATRCQLTPLSHHVPRRARCYWIGLREMAQRGSDAIYGASPGRCAQLR